MNPRAENKNRWFSIIKSKVKNEPRRPISRPVDENSVYSLCAPDDRLATTFSEWRAVMDPGAKNEDQGVSVIKSNGEDEPSYPISKPVDGNSSQISAHLGTYSLFAPGNQLDTIFNESMWNYAIQYELFDALNSKPKC